MACIIGKKILKHTASLGPNVEVQGILRLVPQYVYPQAFIQPSLMLPSQVASSVSSPYLDYSAAYAQYASAAYEHYPYASSPGFVGYGYTAATPTGGPTAPTPAQTLANAATATPAFIQYPPQQHLQPERMQ
ncbi:hypothetical protein MHYP_G00330910 [Metynnis hypsauchen]